MTNDELFIFYTECGTNELQFLTTRYAAEALTEDHLLHFAFCSSATYNMAVSLAKRRLRDGAMPEKIVAGFRLYEEFILMQKYRVWN